MNLLYIDANIYLGFYNSNQREFKKLLDSLIELKHNILLTDQICNEITRNKLKVFRGSIESYVSQLSLLPTTLPEHFDDETSPSFSDWNKKRREIDDKIKESNKEIIPLLDAASKDISKSVDTVSKKLEPLFADAKEATDADIFKARLRREVGNPPGKRDDPLGDQLSWEVLLTNVPKMSKLMIVSSDRDYYSENKNKKELYLNPFLVQDLKSANPAIEFEVFNKLSEALREFAKLTEIKSLPPADTLNKISAGEDVSLRSFNSFGREFLPKKPTLCPNCQSTNSFLDGAYLRSQYGRLTLQFICTQCRYHLDTGDSFE
jgi:hypothetical protein